MQAFLPMLCKRSTAGGLRDIIKAMSEGFPNGEAKFIMEEKLDGERMQIHKRGSEYFYCSR